MDKPSADHLSLLVRAAQTFNSSLDLSEVLNRVMDQVIAVTHAERGFLVLRQADGHVLFKAARAIDQQTIDDPAFQVSRGVVERVLDEGEPQLTSDAQSDSWLLSRESVVGLHLRSILCVPIRLRDKAIGAIYVDNRLQAGIFNRDHLSLISAIADHAATAIENARLYEVAVEKGRLERELQVAYTVQASLLPGAEPQLPGWTFSSYWQPAREVAGDFYDFVPLGEDRLGVIVADVSDKGMPAALFMAVCRSLLRATVTTANSIEAAARQANNLICADASNGMFVTLFYAEIQTGSGEITYVNAGHNPPLWHAAESGVLKRLTRTGPAMGVMPDYEYAVDRATLQPDDTLVIYTDGLTEAFDAGLAAFGEERLAETLRKSAPWHSAASVVTALVNALRVHVDGTPQSDDITLTVLQHRN